MHVIKKILCLLLLATCGFSATAQTTLNLYPLNATIGMKFFAEKKISLESRLDFQLNFEGDVNLFVSPELYALFNFPREEGFLFYTGLGLGASIFNQAESMFVASVPIGITWYPGVQRRIALVGESGIRLHAGYSVIIGSYANVGLQIRLRKND